MKPRLLDWLCCPLCGGDFELRTDTARPATPSTEAAGPSPCRTCHNPDAKHRRGDVRGNCADCYGLEVEQGTLRCGKGHVFPILEGVPRLMVDAAAEMAGNGIMASDAKSIKASFDREWSHFDYGDLTWSQTVDERRQIFVREVRAREADLQGRVVLDAGCGNGSLSRALNEFGCEVVAADVSTSVVAAYRHFACLGNDRTHFIQADLMNPPFRSESFDVLYSCGVLHHTPNTRRALGALVPSLAPGGTVYVWLYWRLPGLRHRVNQGLRTLIAPLPPPLKHNAVRLLLVAVLAMRAIRRRWGGRTREQDALSARELLVLLLDHHTPRYRWEHSPDEVHRWYGDLGLTDAETTEKREWGFGVAARKPGR